LKVARGKILGSNRLLVSLLATPRGVKLAEGWKMAGALG